MLGIDCVSFWLTENHFLKFDSSVNVIWISIWGDGDNPLGEPIPISPGIRQLVDNIDERMVIQQNDGGICYVDINTGETIHDFVQRFGEDLDYLENLPPCQIKSESLPTMGSLSTIRIMDYYNQLMIKNAIEKLRASLKTE
jgi:hypothetical protein